jgi:hypothetical protein
MVNEMEVFDIPEWLSTDNFAFDINKVLDNSLYYPCARFDGDPVKYLMGNVFSFIYVDCGVSKVDFQQSINNPGFRGYHIIHRQTISQNQLAPGGWSIRIQPDHNEKNPNDNFYTNWIKEPFCEWIIFERDDDRDESYNSKRFSLIYLCADGVAAYQAMYLSNNIKHKIIAIIQPGHGFGGNWTNFTDRNKIFAKSVFYNKYQLPDYIVNGGWGGSDSYSKPIWNEYSELVKIIKTRGSTLAIWKR